jgi:hypothetical protein
MYLFMLLFNDAIRSSVSVTSNGRMIRKGYRMKWLWPNLKYYPGSCLEGLTKAARNLI